MQLAYTMADLKISLKLNLKLLLLSMTIIYYNFYNVIHADLLQPFHGNDEKILKVQINALCLIKVNIFHTM